MQQEEGQDTRGGQARGGSRESGGPPGQQRQGATKIAWNESIGKQHAGCTSVPVECAVIRYSIFRYFQTSGWYHIDLAGTVQHRVDKTDFGGQRALSAAHLRACMWGRTSRQPKAPFPSRKRLCLGSSQRTQKEEPDLYSFTVPGKRYGISIHQYMRHRENERQSGTCPALERGH